MPSPSRSVVPSMGCDSNGNSDSIGEALNHGGGILVLVFILGSSKPQGPGLTDAAATLSAAELQLRIAARMVNGRCFWLGCLAGWRPWAPWWSGSVWPPTGGWCMAATGSRTRRLITPAVEEQELSALIPCAAPTTAGALGGNRWLRQWRRARPSGPAFDTGFHSTFGAGCFPPMLVPESWRWRACAASVFHGLNQPAHSAEVGDGPARPSPSVPRAMG